MSMLELAELIYELDDAGFYVEEISELTGIDADFVDQMIAELW